MAAERIPMRKVLDILRLAYEAERSQREIAGSLALSQSTVSECLARFRASGLSWPLAPELDEGALEGRLFARPPLPATVDRPRPDWATVHRELKRTGVTLQLLWVEYQHAHEGTPERGRCYQYMPFRPSATCASIQARCGAQAERVSVGIPSKAGGRGGGV